MDYYFWMGFHLLFIFKPVLAGLFMFRSMDKPTKIFWVGTLWTFIVEVLAYRSVLSGNTTNVDLYASSGLVQLLLTIWYFNELLPFFKRNNIGIIIGGTGILLALINFIWLEPLGTFPRNFVILQAVLTVGMCLAYMRSCIVSKQKGIRSYFPHFYLSAFLAALWIMLAVQFSFYDQLHVAMGSNKWLLNHSLQFCNAAYGCAVAVTMLGIRKRIHYAA